ncbi:acyl carrier protein [Alphaproteobacteria bacterium 46_93_T64]|nr:acyl carrier protein [Alphaproteobacteria bacterium 46_93_T64]
MTREEVEQKLHEFLVDLFEVEKELIKPDALLADDLDLDSIDAVDLVVSFQDLIGKRVKADDFKNVRTVNDIVDQIYNVVAKA